MRSFPQLIIRKALELLPDDPVALRALARVFMATNRPAAVVPLLEHLLAGNAADTPSRLALAAAYARIGRRKEASAAVEEAVNPDPGSDTARGKLKDSGEDSQLLRLR